MACRPLRYPAAALGLILALAAGCGPDRSADTAKIVPPASPAINSPSATPASPTASPSASPTARPSASPRATKRPPAKATSRYVFPVKNSGASFGRTHAGYPASDIFTGCGTPALAATDGVVLEVNRVDRYDPNNDVPADRGGLSVSLLGDDGVRYYGSHLSSIAGGIRPGVRVKAGQQFGKVGKTGRASGVCHLHFGISPPCARTGDWWIRRGAVWPARFLDAWKAGRSLSPAKTVTSYRKTNGCPPEPAG